MPKAKKETLGVCNGNSIICPCTDIEKQTTKCYEVCRTKLDECEIYKRYGECAGTECAKFQSPCVYCEDYQHDCEECKYFSGTKKAAQSS